MRTEQIKEPGDTDLFEKRHLRAEACKSSDANTSRRRRPTFYRFIVPYGARFQRQGKRRPARVTDLILAALLFDDSSSLKEYLQQEKLCQMKLLRGFHDATDQAAAMH